MAVRLLQSSLRRVRKRLVGSVGLVKGDRDMDTSPQPEQSWPSAPRSQAQPGYAHPRGCASPPGPHEGSATDTLDARQSLATCVPRQSLGSKEKGPAPRVGCPPIL